MGYLSDYRWRCELMLLFYRLETWRNREREEEDDLAFPDEIDTPKEIPARIRFQRYRGMRSFRTSPWDPYENLPRDYARIFQFEDFKRTERGVRRRAEQEGSGVEVGAIPPSLNVQLISSPAWHAGDCTCSRSAARSGRSQIAVRPVRIITT